MQRTWFLLCSAVSGATGGQPAAQQRGQVGRTYQWYQPWHPNVTVGTSCGIRTRRAQSPARRRMPCRPVVPHLWPQTPRQRTWSLASLPLGSTSFDHAACLWRHPLTKTVCPPTVFVLEKVANSDICEFLASRTREQRFDACRCALTHSFRTDAQERAIRFMLMVAACMLVARLHVGCPLACWLKHISKYTIYCSAASFPLVPSGTGCASTMIAVVA